MYNGWLCVCACCPLSCWLYLIAHSTSNVTSRAFWRFYVAPRVCICAVRMYASVCHWYNCCGFTNIRIYTHTPHVASLSSLFLLLMLLLPLYYCVRHVLMLMRYVYIALRLMTDIFTIFTSSRNILNLQLQHFCKYTLEFDENPLENQSAVVETPLLGRSLFYQSKMRSDSRSELWREPGR